MSQPAPLDPTLMELVLPHGDIPENPAALLRRLAQMRQDPELAPQIDLTLLERIRALQKGLKDCREIQNRLQDVINKLSRLPAYTAIIRRVYATPPPITVQVQHGNTRRVVGLADGVDPATLRAGDEVLLNAELNVVLRKLPERPPEGETCLFERRTAGGQLVVRSRDEELVIDAAGRLEGVDLERGDKLCWDRNLMMAFFKLDKAEETGWFLEGTPAETFDHIGGLSRQITLLQRTLRLHILEPERVIRYRLRRKGSVLLYGPVGTGKTMLARALAHWLAGLSRGGQARFMNIKPAALHSMWYSESERNYREAFRIARQTASRQPDVPVIMFFDEVDAIGGTRGQGHLRVNDQVLTAFFAELDGLEQRPPNLVVVGATNRPDALDPGLVRPGRLGDLMLEVPRPNRKAALEILHKHLPDDLPYARDGHGDDALATRQALIQTAIARLYALNADNQLATLTFRDGTHRPVRAPDLLNGAMLANIARAASERACVRESELGKADGLRLEDVLHAINAELEATARLLTPVNCRSHLAGLPHDNDIVNVQPVARPVPQPERYLNPE